MRATVLETVILAFVALSGVFVSASATCPIPVPTGLTASSGTYGNRIHLRWNPVDEATYYNLYRSTTARGPYVNFATWSGTSWDDSQVDVGKTYYYKISANNSATDNTCRSGLSEYVTGYAEEATTESAGGVPILPREDIPARIASEEEIAAPSPSPTGTNSAAANGIEPRDTSPDSRQSAVDWVNSFWLPVLAGLVVAGVAAVAVSKRFRSVALKATKFSGHRATPVPRPPRGRTRGGGAAHSRRP